MTLPVEWEADDCWNEDDREFAEGMVAILHQAYNAKGVDSPTDALLARLCVEMNIIRSLLNRRLDDGMPAFTKGEGL